MLSGQEGSRGGTENISTRPCYGMSRSAILVPVGFTRCPSSDHASRLDVEWHTLDAVTSPTLQSLTLLNHEVTCASGHCALQPLAQQLSLDFAAFASGRHQSLDAWCFREDVSTVEQDSPQVPARSAPPGNRVCHGMHQMNLPLRTFTRGAAVRHDFTLSLMRWYSHVLCSTVSGDGCSDASRCAG